MEYDDQQKGEMIMQAGLKSVNLIPIRHGTTFDHWNMSMNGKSDPPGQYPHIGVVNPAGDTITYKIVDSKGITFDTQHPIYIQAGPNKPTTGVDPQFTPTLSVNNTTLTLTDSNTKEGPYTYVMNFVNASKLDPVIDNSGPGRRDFTWYAVGAVGLLVIALLLFRALSKRQAN